MMKISKIFAGCAALVMAAATVMSVSAADSRVWINDWKLKEQRKVLSFDNMNTSSPWNGSWVQFYSYDAELSDVTLTFTIDTTNAIWKLDDDGVPLNESGSYCVLRVNNADESDNTTQAIYEDGNYVGGYDCTNDNGVYTIKVKGSELKAQADSGNGQINKENVTLANGSTKTVYCVGFNIQFGNFANATWNVSVSGDSIIPFSGVDENGRGILDILVPKQDISKASATLSSSTYAYDGNAKRPSVTVKLGGNTLKNGTDYSVSYKNNTEVGTATVTITGEGYYKGTITKTFSIKNDFTKAVVSDITSKTYTGKAQTQNITVKYNGKTLKNGTDYTVSYSNNTKVGTAKVTITGKSNYTGTISKTFSIKNDFTKASVSGISNKTFTGKAQTQKITVKFGGKTLKSGTDYTISYSNNTKVGKATVKIVGKGNYTGTITKTFKINPAKQTINKLTAKSKGFTASWSKKDHATCYEIQYSTDSKFKSVSKATITSKSTTSKSFTKLKASKKYYVRMRIYTTVNGTKYYGAWSATKTITTKK